MRKSRDNNYPELYPGQFDLLCNAPPSRAPTWSRGTFSSMHSSPYTLVSLRTRLPTYLSPYALVSLHTRLTITSIYQLEEHSVSRYLSEIVHLSRRHSRSSQYATRKLSCRLDAINAPHLCGSQPCHQLTRVTG